LAPAAARQRSESGFEALHVVPGSAFSGLLRGTLERGGGREVKNLGDGLMVVFASDAQVDQ
jgi:hypothetical protein